MKSYRSRVVAGFAVVVVALCLMSVGIVAAQGVLALDAISKAHGVQGLPPLSVQMTGMVEREGSKPEPFRLVATRDEELRIEYGTQGKDTLVASQKLNFRDDGTKFSYAKAPAGFSELDITGLFLIEQLRHRAVRVEVASDRVKFGEVSTQRIRVESERTELHRGSIKVNDRVDLFVTDAGVLAAVSRSFYEGRPEHYTQTFTFSNYKKTADGVLRPYQIDVYIKGHRRQSFTIETYQFDTSPDRNLFTSRRAQ